MTVEEFATVLIDTADAGGFHALGVRRVSVLRMRRESNPRAWRRCSTTSGTA